MTAPELIAQKFRIKSLLGRGGMGEVYLALDETLGARRVALKLLRIDEEEMRKRFEQEARAAANLQHRNIITIYEYGQHRGQPYIAMEFISGATLGAVIAEHRPLSLATRLELIEQACSGVAHAHSQGIIHRDIKPSNLIVDHEGCLRILDFGIAHVPAANLTRGPAMLGTPNYMSPEQVNGESLDRRSDVFSLGLVLFELVAHQQAFAGESMRVLDRIRFEAPAPLTLSPSGEVPDAVKRIVKRALEKRPDDRYQTLLEMQRELRHARGGTGTAWSNVQVPTTVIAKPSGKLGSPAQPRPAASSGRPDPAEGRWGGKPPTGGTPAPSGPLSQRRRELAERHVTLGRQAFNRHDYTRAVDELEQAAALDQSHAEAAKLLEQARQRLAGQQTEQVARLLADAERQFARGDLAAARARVDEANALDAEHPHVIELAETIALAEVEAHLQSCLERAQSALAAGELSRCAALLDEAGLCLAEGGASGSPKAGHRPADAPGLVELRQQLDEAYAARARERRLERAVAQGRAHLEQRELDRALRAAEGALLEDPDHPAARALRADVLAAQAGAVSEPDAAETTSEPPDENDTRPILVTELQDHARHVMGGGSASVAGADGTADATANGPSWRDRLARVVAAVTGTLARRRQA
ncbi:MAG: protein kinase [Luteitalea sp.]|nr:protein kinase [Luteitalea sp.]